MLDSEDEQCYGRVVDPIPPVNMTVITDKVACAKRGGATFLNAQRVDPYTFECTTGHVPCSAYTAPSDTICVKPYEKEFECPIIDLFVVHQELIPHLTAHGYQVTEDGYQQDGGFKTHIAFSKSIKRKEVSHEPIISTALNSVVPCYGTERESLVLGDKGLELIKFPIEKEDPIV